MSIENAIRNRAVLLERLGKSALNAKYPNEFELYTIALELVDADYNTLRYFVFPVNPSALDESEPKITNIKKTLTGVTSLRTSSFVPVDINVNGNFGRKFKVLLGTDYVDFASSFATDEGQITFGSIGAGVKEFFDSRVKTGFGCVKILQEICDQVNIIDEKGPRKLLWYNLAFGSAYIVEPILFKIGMSQESNMIHNYTMQLKAIAPLAALKSAQTVEDSRKELSTTGYVQSQMDRVVNELSNLLR